MSKGLISFFRRAFRSRRQALRSLNCSVMLPVKVIQRRAVPLRYFWKNSQRGQAAWNKLLQSFVTGIIVI